MTPDDLKQARKSLGMSQTELGEAFGVSRWTIARMEEGGDIPPWVPLAMAELRRRYKRRQDRTSQTAGNAPSG